MIDERVKDAWMRAGTGAAPLSRAAIEQLMQPAALRTGRALEFIATTYVTMFALAAAFAAANVYGYRENARMAAVEGGVLVLSAIFAALGARVRSQLRRIGRADLPLAEAVERRLGFYGRQVEPWLVAAATAPSLMTFALVSFIENDRGSYRINHPIEFVLVNAVMFVGVYLALRLSMIPTVREMRAVLHDLRAQVVEETPAMVAVRRRARAWTGVAVVVLALIVLFTIVLWLKVA